MTTMDTINDMVAKFEAKQTQLENMQMKGVITVWEMSAKAQDNFEQFKSELFWFVMSAQD